MATGDLELEDSPANGAESPFGLKFPIRGQISCFAERQMHFLIKVFAELAIAPENLVGDVFSDERPSLFEKGVVFGRKRDAREVH